MNRQPGTPAFKPGRMSMSTGNYTAVINLVRVRAARLAGGSARYSCRKARSTSGSGSRPRPGPCGTVIRPRAGVAAPP
jgi:hypothetical protein